MLQLFFLFEPVVGTGLGCEQPATRGFECVVDGYAANLVAAGERLRFHYPVCKPAKWLGDGVG